MKVNGTIKLINDTVTFDSGFRKRELVVITKEQYPQELLIQFIQDKCDILNQYSKGDLVDININLKGREWINPEGASKYFNSIEGWRIEKSETIEDAAAVTPSVEQPTGENDDDLPF